MVAVAKVTIQEMKDTSRILDLKYKLMTIELLNLAKQRFTYRELSAMVHLPETVLSRYVKGHVLPTAQRAEEINKTLQRYMSLDKELLERIHFDDGGYFDNTAIIGDTLLMERAVQHAVGKFAGKRVTKIMTAAVDGIPLATLLAHRLGVGLLVAKKAREVGVREFIDDIFDSGETQRAMMKIIQKAKAEVIGIYALVSIGTDWKARIESAGNVPVEVVTPVIKKEPKEKERESRETREVREISA